MPNDIIATAPEFVKCLEGLSGAVGQARLDGGPHSRMNGVGPVCDHLAIIAEPLGNQRRLKSQPTGFLERPEVNLDQIEAARSEGFDIRLERLGSMVIAEEPELVRPRNRDGSDVRLPHREIDTAGVLAAERIIGILTRDQFENFICFLDLSGENRNHIENATVEPQPSCADEPDLGFRPTIPLQAAGTRPEPPVSDPSVNDTMSRATATADPELDPPGM